MGLEQEARQSMRTSGGQNKGGLTDELDGRRVAVDVDHDVERRAGVESREEDALVGAVHAEHHVAAGRVVEREHDADVDVALGQRLAPEALPARQVWNFRERPPLFTRSLSQEGFQFNSLEKTSRRLADGQLTGAGVFRQGAAQGSGVDGGEADAQHAVPRGGRLGHSEVDLRFKRGHREAFRWSARSDDAKECPAACVNPFKGRPRLNGRRTDR